MKREGTLNLFDTHIGVWEEPGGPVMPRSPVETAMLRGMRALLGVLVQRGWHVGKDPRVVRDFPSLAESHYYARKGDLELVAEHNGRHTKYELFQNVANVENRNGGRYDFRKFERMPPRLRLECLVAMTTIVRWLLGKGYVFNDRVFVRDGEPLVVTLRRAASDREEGLTPLERFNRHWQKGRFERDESGWPVRREYASCASYGIDGTGRPLSPGDTRYAYVQGRLQRCTVYPNMNNGWTGEYGGQRWWFQARDLFHHDAPETLPRRHVPGQLARVARELEKALKAKDWRRVEVLGGVAKRLSARPEAA